MNVEKLKQILNSVPDNYEVTLLIRYYDENIIADIESSHIISNEIELIGDAL